MKINFTYRRPEERRKQESKPAPPAGMYDATIYSVTEWTNKTTGKSKLFVNLAIGNDYAFGASFNFNSEKESQREYAQSAFSELLDACGIDGATFDDTDILVGKKLVVKLEDGIYGLQATKFLKTGTIFVDTPMPLSRYSKEQQDDEDGEPPF